MFWLTAPILKNSLFLTGIYFKFLKYALEQLQPTFDLCEKIGKVIIKLEKN